MSQGHFEIATRLRAPPEEVWARATAIEGISDELWPWLRMSIPRGLDAEAFGAALRGGHAALPAALGRSWLLLFGALPVDWDDIGIAEVGPGHRFLERSSMASLGAWQHERVVEATPGGSRVTDRLTWTARALVPAGAARALVAAVFGHRHRRLRARFGQLD